MRVLVYDVETTISSKGSALDHRNKLCYTGLYDGDTYHLLDIEYTGSINKENLKIWKEVIASADLLIGANLKFDLHWAKRLGVDFSHCQVWDTQLVEFILSNQTTPYPSLNECCEKRGLGTKLDIVERDYWSKGIDTPDIPREILEEYLQQDLYLTYVLYLKQKEEIDEQTE